MAIVRLEGLGPLKNPMTTSGKKHESEGKKGTETLVGQGVGWSK
jgi:hypothetical protein